MPFFFCDLSDFRELTDTEGDSAIETDSSSMVSSLEDSSLEDDSVTDHDSETDLWDGFDFPQLTAEEDAQLTIALQGDPLQPNSIETSTAATSPHEATVDNSYTHSGDQAPTDRDASELVSSSPPPYMTESNNSQPVHPFFYINNSMTPISSTDGQFYIAVDRVYHVIGQM